MTSEIVCIGGANMDIRAKAAGPLRHDASNPGTVSVVPGGVARNVAENLARLGLGVSLISAVGDDDLGRELRASLDAAGVDVSLTLSLPDAATGLYVAVLESSGELSVAVNGMAIMDGLAPQVLEPAAARIAAARYVFADCNLPASTLSWLISLGCRLIVDPISPAKALRLMNLESAEFFAMVLNEYQAETITGMRVGDLPGAKSATRALQRRGFRNVMLSLGSKGVIVAPEGSAEVHLPARAVGESVKDVTGAGDAATAGLIVGLCNGLGFVDAAAVGQAAAAIVVGGGKLSRAALMAKADA